jgi:hypothetical protein
LVIAIRCLYPTRADVMFSGGSISSPSNWRRTYNADSRIACSRDGARHWEILNEGLPENIRGKCRSDLWLSIMDPFLYSLQQRMEKISAATMKAIIGAVSFKAFRRYLKAGIIET